MSCLERIVDCRIELGRIGKGWEGLSNIGDNLKNLGGSGNIWEDRKNWG